MTIENILTRVAEALEANTAAMEKLMASGGGTKPASKPAGKPAGKPASKPASSKAKGPTKESVTERVLGYLKTGDKDERALRKEQIATITEYYGADRFTNIDEKDWPEALSFVDMYEAGETPQFDGAEDGDNNDDMV